MPYLRRKRQSGVVRDTIIMASTAGSAGLWGAMTFASDALSLPGIPGGMGEITVGTLLAGAAWLLQHQAKAAIRQAEINAAALVEQEQRNSSAKLEQEQRNSKRQLEIEQNAALERDRLNQLRVEEAQQYANESTRRGDESATQNRQMLQVLIDQINRPRQQQRQQAAKKVKKPS